MTEVWKKYKMDTQVFLNEELEGRYSGWKKWFRLLLVQGFWAISVFRFGQWVYSLPRMISFLFRAFYIFLEKCIQITTGIMLPASCSAGGGLYIGHFGGVIINGGVKFGENCKISHGVTLGTKGAGRGAGVPMLGNNVYVGAGAKILGDIKVGSNVVVGANAVVVKNVPDNAVVGGVPAKILTSRKN